MKQIFSLAAIALAITFASAAQASEPKTREQAIGVNEVYIPGGLSSDTDAYVIVSGMFPNSCYSWSRSEVSDKSAMVHEVRSFANVTQTMCLMVLVPYSHDVRLGRLDSGEHTLRFLNGDGTYFERKVVVE